MMMKTFLVLSCLMAVTLAASLSLDEHWDQWKAQYEKSYEAKEELVRKRIFQKNLAKIEKHNRLHRKGKVSYSLGVNKFADLRVSEFSARFKGLAQSRVFNRTASPVFSFNNSQALPDSVDWRQKGIVTPVKDQADCGSCWAFSSTGALEGQHALKTGKLVSLSEQNLVDCDPKSFGCGGGWMDWAFAYVKQNGGIDTEASYPYEGVDQNCEYNPKNSGASDTGFVMIKTDDESDLKAAVATIGPVSIAIDASGSDFMFYKSGVYVDPDCSTEFLDHAVLAVGYGTSSSGQDYWLVKNSWDTDWGMDGYILMARNLNNQCGVASHACYPTV